MNQGDIKSKSHLGKWGQLFTSEVCCSVSQCVPPLAALTLLRYTPAPPGIKEMSQNDLIVTCHLNSPVVEMKKERDNICISTTPKSWQLHNRLLHLLSSRRCSIIQRSSMPRPKLSHPGLLLRWCSPAWRIRGTFAPKPHS